MGWADDALVGFDLETTGTDPASSRIVTAALVEAKGGEPTPGRDRHWLVDPGVEIPGEAAAIHGVTTAVARAEGRPAAEAVDEIAAALCARLAAGIPVVVFNAPFDLSLLQAELDRYGLAGLGERLGGRPVGPVVDPLTLDRALDRYRKGSRTLQNACAVYGVALDGAHRAHNDALAAVRVAGAIAARHADRLAGLDAAALHERQAAWHAAWAEDFQGWLRRKKDPAAVVDPAWPLRRAPHAGAGAEAVPAPRAGAVPGAVRGSL